jgi:heme exporter protein C
VSSRTFPPMNGRGLRALSIATVAAMATALALIFFYAPIEAEEGFLQKIFYLHVPLAIITLCGFVIGGILAIVHLRTRDRRWDLRSYVAIHMSLIFGVGTLITGSIWARGSWGHWWVWSEPTLVSFLIVMLLYATYQPLRFAIEDPERQARYASVFAIVAGAFVPLNFLAVRLSTEYLHPRVLGSSSNLPAPMAFTFLVSLVAMALLFATLYAYELTAKRTRMLLKSRSRILGFQGSSPPAHSDSARARPVPPGPAREAPAPMAPPASAQLR